MLTQASWGEELVPVHWRVLVLPSGGQDHAPEDVKQPVC